MNKKFIIISERSLDDFFWPLAKAIAREHSLQQEITVIFLTNNAKYSQLAPERNLTVLDYSKTSNTTAKCNHENATLNEKNLNAIWHKVSSDRLLHYFRPNGITFTAKSELSTWLYRKALLLEQIIDPNAQNYIVMEPVTDILAHVLHTIAGHKNNVFFRMIGQNRLTNGYYFISEFPSDKATLSSPLSVGLDIAENIVENFISKLCEPSPKAAAISSQTTYNWQLLRVFKALVGLMLARRRFISYTELTDYEKSINILSRFRNQLYLKCLMRWEPLHDQEKYFLFPLHYFPECSSTFWANNQNDQISLINRLSQSLPFGYHLVVKEHVAFPGYRPLEHYKQIRRLPNVRLIDPNTPSRHLILNSSGVVTISSTLGLEALFLGKPILMFGNCMYEDFDGVYKISPGDDSLRLIREILEKFTTSPQIDSLKNKNLLMNQVCKWFSGSVRWPNENTSNEKNITLLAKALISC